jgi:hypothetical protein
LGIERLFNYKLKQIMNRIYRRSDGYALRMIHNVRPAVELPGASMWPALVVTFGILITAAALLVLLLGG